MAINKKLIHFKTRAAFEIQLAEKNILDTSIVFIQDANLIWTHGTYYCLPSDEVFISDGIEPDGDQDLWVDTSDNIADVTPKEVYVGETEPTNKEVIWINPSNGKVKYKDGDHWVEISYKYIPPIITYFRDSNSSTILEQKVTDMSWIKGRRCLAKKTSDGVAICYLDENNSELFHDGTTTAALDGSMGQWMTDLPEYYFYVDESAKGVHALNLSQYSQEGWQKSRRVLLGVTKGIVTNSKLWSKSGSTPTVNQTISTFHTQATACGSGFDIIDYETHCKLAHMFYTKYGNTDPQNISQFGTGSSTTGRTSGTTASLGNTDGKSSTQVNIFGVEDPYGNVFEFMGGITGNGSTYYVGYDGLVTDAIPANSRTVSANSVSANSSTYGVVVEGGFISRVKWGAYGDMIPTKFNGSDTTYYADYYAVLDSGWGIVRRSGPNYTPDCGFALFYKSKSSFSTSETGSRLQYRGNITVIEDPAEFIALPVGF